MINHVVYNSYSYFVLDNEQPRQLNMSAMNDPGNRNKPDPFQPPSQLALAPSITAGAAEPKSNASSSNYAPAHLPLTARKNR